MIVAPTTPQQRTEFAPKTLRNRRTKQRKRLRALQEAGIEPPTELLNIVAGINGRPRLSDEDIKLPKHASARRTRIYRSNGDAARLALAQPKAAGALALLVCAPAAPVSAAFVSAALVSAAAEPTAAKNAAAEPAAAEPFAALTTTSLAIAEAEAKAERHAAERRERQLYKLKRHLDARNDSDGCVADGPRAISTVARDSYYIAIKYRDGLSELSEARNSYFVAIWTDSPPLFFIATQIGAGS